MPEVRSDRKRLRKLIDWSISSIEEVRDAMANDKEYEDLDEYHRVRHVGEMSSTISTLLRIRKFVMGGKSVKGREAEGKCPVCDGLVSVTVFGEDRIAELKRVNDDLQIRLELWRRSRREGGPGSRWLKQGKWRSGR